MLHSFAEEFFQNFFVCFTRDERNFYDLKNFNLFFIMATVLFGLTRVDRKCLPFFPARSLILKAVYELHQRARYVFFVE